MKKLFLLFIICFTSIALCSCGLISSKPVETEKYHMGTVITQKIYGPNAQRAADQVEKRMVDIEATMTVNAPGGDVNTLNAAAGKESVRLGSDTIFVLQRAKRYAELSKGTFDVTVGPLVKAWGIFTDHPRMPAPDEIKQLMGFIDYRTLSVDEANNTAKLANSGQLVDLGGIAKGYAGDEAIRIYKENGIKSAFVNLGGNVVVLGNKPDGKPWSIGVQNPRAETGRYLGILKLTDKAVVSSGDYERFFEKDNVRYHHILDPRTGYPANAGLIGTTIVADSSTDGDALSTATFVLGLEEGMKLVESLPGVDALFVTKDKKVYITSGLKDKFTFDDESKEYEYVEKR